MLSRIKLLSFKDTWIIIALINKNHPEKKLGELSHKLSLIERTSIFYFNPNSTCDFSVHKYGLSQYYLPCGFPEETNSKDANEFYSIISGLLSQKKKILLFSSPLPQVQEVFLAAAYQNKKDLGASLFLISSYFDESISIIYNPLFLLAWHEQLLKRPMNPEEPIQLQDFRMLTDNIKSAYLGLADVEVERAEQFLKLKEHFSYLGQFFKNFSEIGPKHFIKQLSPNLHQQQHLKLFVMHEKLVRPNAQHLIYKGKKPVNLKKSMSRNAKNQIFKAMTIPQLDDTFKKKLCRTFIEVVSAELFRLLVYRTQPKTRLAYAPQLQDYGILSTEIPNFISVLEALQIKNTINHTTIDKLKDNINHIKFGRFLIASIWLGEFDLKLDNLGTDKPTGSFLYKTDHGCCLPSTWRKHHFNPLSTTQYIPDVAGLRITHEVLDSLPEPGPYNAFNWFNFKRQGITYKTCTFLDAVTICNIWLSKSFNRDMNSTIHEITLISDEAIEQFVSLIKCQFLNIFDIQGCFNDFIEEVAEDICIELQDRQMQLHKAALGNKSFLNYLKCTSKEQQTMDFKKRLPNFTLFEKYKLACGVRSTEQMQALIKSAKQGQCGFLMEEKKIEHLNPIQNTQVYQFFPHPKTDSNGKIASNTHSTSPS